MFNIEIISVDGIIFQDQAVQVVVPTISGEVGFMQDHESLISELKEGTIKILDSNEKLIKEIEVKSGTVEMHNQDKLVVLIDS